MATAEKPLAPQGADANGEGHTTKKQCWYKFDGVQVAEGYNLLGLGRGALVMSNIFLSSAFILLASEQAGCVEENDDGGIDVLENCDERVYGFKPASFVTNIAVITGLGAAFCMPVVGAVVDCTDHRRAVGVWSAVIMIIIQGAQIGLTVKTWFIMAIFQALSGVLYQVLVLSIYAYMPDIATVVGEAVMTKHTATWVMTQFASQLTFLLVVVGVSTAAGFGEVLLAQFSQGLNIVISGIFLYLGWRLMDNVPARRQLEEGQSLWTVGFSQVIKTAFKIQRDYKRGLRWFFMSLAFAEATTNAFTVVSVIYLGDQIGLTSNAIGVFFMATLGGVLPGAAIGSRITARMNPKSSWMLNMSLFFVWTAAGAVAFDYLPKNAIYIWGFVVGCFLGWFYSCENIFFSMVLPKGQEAELSGFYIYCTQILGWLPPLIFTIMVENDISQTYAVVVVVMFYPIAIMLLLCAAPWEEILQESGRLEGSNETSDKGTNDEKLEESADKSSEEADGTIQATTGVVDC